MIIFVNPVIIYIPSYRASLIIIIIIFCCIVSLNFVSAHGVRMAEENSFKEEFKRYKKKSTNLEEILNLRTPQQLRSFEGKLLAR